MGGTGLEFLSGHPAPLIPPFSAGLHQAVTGHGPAMGQASAHEMGSLGLFILLSVFLN
jgi:hypothetical protein